MKNILWFLPVLCLVGCNQPDDKTPIAKPVIIATRFQFQCIHTPIGYPNLTIMIDNMTHKEIIIASTGNSCCIIETRDLAAENK